MTPAVRKHPGVWTKETEPDANGQRFVSKGGRERKRFNRRIDRVALHVDLTILARLASALADARVIPLAA